MIKQQMYTIEKVKMKPVTEQLSTNSFVFHKKITTTQLLSLIALPNGSIFAEGIMKAK